MKFVTCASSGKETEGAFVFVTERGGPLSVDALQRIVKEAGLDRQDRSASPPAHATPRRRLRHD